MCAVAKKDGQSTSRMEMNGRIVVPKDIRKAVGARLGTRFIWELLEDGSIRVSAKCRRPVEAEDMSSTAIDEFANQ